MTDTNKLKELAEAAANRARRHWYTEDDCCWWTGNVDEGNFLAAANPQAILGLLERLEKAEQHWANENSNNMALIAEVERLRKDAERYRWIKAESNLTDYVDSYALPMVNAWDLRPGPQPNTQYPSLDEAIDAVIDAALEGGGR